MALDQSNSYEYAGPGSKRRPRVRVADDEIPQRIKRKKERETQHALPPRPIENINARTWTAQGLRNTLIRLTLQYSSFGDIVDRLDREGYPSVTKLTVSKLRTDAMQVIKVAIEEGLIDEQQLTQYREREQRKYRERFKSKRAVA